MSQETGAEVHEVGDMAPGCPDAASSRAAWRVGVDAERIGKDLMRADDPAPNLRELTVNEDSTQKITEVEGSSHVA
jgi:hypothetical protein